MVDVGIEAIRYFGNARAAGISTAADLSYTYNRSNGFSDELRSAGHRVKFYFTGTDVWETDIRDTDQGGGGEDASWVDDVDIFWLETHGGHTDTGQARMLYDTKRNEWRTYSSTWQLGENWNAEFVMAFSCETVDRGNVGGLWNIFSRLHMYCGAYENMYDGPTTDECGEDVASNLTDGDTVSASWIDGVSDWWVDNHPITVCPGDSATWNNGNIRWDLSIMNRDHLAGHGNSEPDLPVNQQACLLYRWAEG